MNERTDSQLLRDYAEDRCEVAFAELVRRHLDFVYSAALRMVSDVHLAEDATQGTFIALAKNARYLTNHPVLSGWLHRTAQNIAAQTVRTNLRRSAREKEAVVMNAQNGEESDVAWKQVAPHLDKVLGELREGDRDLLLMRFFEHKSAREIAQTLGVGYEAAQKRVNRALERMREGFVKHGIVMGTSGFIAIISAHAVHAAPAGLATTISKSSVLAGTTIATKAIATKAIIMTTLQKTFVAIALVTTGAIVVGIYEGRHIAELKSELNEVTRQHEPLIQKVEQLTRDYNDATEQLATMRQENDRLKHASLEVPKLRGDAVRLRQSQQEIARLKAGQRTNALGDLMARWMNDPEHRGQRRAIHEKEIKNTYAFLFREMDLSPEAQQKLIDILTDKETFTLDQSMSILSGGNQVEDSDFQREMIAAMNQFNSDIENLLGADGFRKFNELKAILPDRASLDLFKEKIKKMPLTSDQEAQLLSTMIRERANTPFAAPSDDLQWKSDPDTEQKVINAHEQMNRQILSQATAFLTPDQLAALTRFQSNQLASNIESLRLLRRISGGKSINNGNQ